jgi:hypothetical protein
LLHSIGLDRSSVIVGKRMTALDKLGRAQITSRVLGPFWGHRAIEQGKNAKFSKTQPSENVIETTHTT